MMSRPFLFIVIAVLISILAGCSPQDATLEEKPSDVTQAQEKPSQLDESQSIEGQIIEAQKIEAEDLDPNLQNELDLLKQKTGSYYWNDTTENPLIYIGMGLQPTGGYSISAERLTLEGKALKILVSTKAPGSDEMVTQALTYPFLLLKLPTDTEFDTLSVVDQAGMPYDLLTLNSESAQVIQGTYVGQIDSTSIEVQVGESFMVFRNFLMTELVDAIESGTLVELSYVETNEGQYQLYQIKPLE